MQTKICLTCGIDKSLDQFSKHKTGKYGRNPHCKKCESEMRRVKHTLIECPYCYREFVPKRSDQVYCSSKCYDRHHNILNKEKNSKYNKEYHKRTYVNRRDKMIERTSKWQQENKEHRAEYLKDYCEKHKDELTAKIKQKRRENVLYRLYLNIASRMDRTIKDAGAKKCKRGITLLGCSMEELKDHFESKFAFGMCWKNYSEWEIDHCLPISSFDLLNPREQEICFHYTNLQPLWKIDNARKGISII